MIIYVEIVLSIIINEKISLNQTSDLNYSLYADDRLIAKNIRETAFRSSDKNVVTIIPYFKDDFLIRFGKGMYLYRSKLKRNKKVSVEKMKYVRYGFRWNVYENNDGHKIGYKDFCLEVGDNIKDSEDKVVTLQPCSEKSSQLFDSARIPIISDSMEKKSEEKEPEKMKNKIVEIEKTKEESESLETNYEDLRELADKLHNSTGKTVKLYINNYKPIVYAKNKGYKKRKHSHTEKHSPNKY